LSERGVTDASCDLVFVGVYDSDAEFKTDIENQNQKHSDFRIAYILSASTISVQYSDQARHLFASMPRTAWLPLSFVSVLKSGAIYVPVDPATPSERIAVIMDEIKPDIVLTLSANQALLPQGIAASVHLVSIDALVELFVSEDKPLPLHILGSGGESVSADACRKAMSLKPELCVLVGYGLAEATIACAERKFSGGVKGKSYTPISRALPGYKIYILAEDGCILPFGAAGEIAIGGDVLSPGYINNTNLSHEEFVNGSKVIDGERIYKTGDHARFLPNGELLFLGRKDDQVQIQGVRVELGEIESVLKSVSRSKNVAVKVMGTGAHAKVIAYMDTPDYTRAEIRAELQSRLPKQMQPAALVEGSLPLNVNNKIDKNLYPPQSLKILILVST